MHKSSTTRARMGRDQLLSNRESSRLAKRSRIKKQPDFTIETPSPAVLKEATGSDQPDVQQQLINQVCRALWMPEGLGEVEKLTRIQSAISSLQGIKPTDEIEGMLAVQMVGTHNAVMDCLGRAMIEGQTFAGRDLNLKHAAKLLAIFSRQIEVLDKHRGKGQQKVTVEHVHVEAGGQAMVGHFETGKTAGARGTGADPEIKAITDDPGETIDIDLEVKKSEPSRKT